MIKPAFQSFLPRSNHHPDAPEMKSKVRSKDLALKLPLITPLSGCLLAVPSLKHHHLHFAWDIHEYAAQFSRLFSGMSAHY